MYASSEILISLLLARNTHTFLESIGLKTLSSQPRARVQASNDPRDGHGRGQMVLKKIFLSDADQVRYSSLICVACLVISARPILSCIVLLQSPNPLSGGVQEIAPSSSPCPSSYRSPRCVRPRPRPRFLPSAVKKSPRVRAEGAFLMGSRQTRGITDLNLLFSNLVIIH